MGPHGLLGDSFTCLYVDYVLSYRYHRAPTVCYWYSFPFLCVDNVRTLQETHIDLHGLLLG
jgi:hypothetical protein